MVWTELAARIEAGGTVLVPGRAIARRIVATWDRTKAGEGRAAWESPSVLTWDAWLERLWEEGVIAGTLEPVHLLAREQELALWTQVLREDGVAVADVQGLAARVAEAYGLAREWGLSDAAAAEAAPGAEPHAFGRWMARFDEACEARGHLPRARLPDVLSAHPEALEPAVGSPLFLYAFDAIAPARRRLLDAFERRGGRWEEIRLPGSGAGVRVAARDPRDEARLAARWVRARLEARPGARLGLVVPDLGARRREVVRALDEMLLTAPCPGPDAPRPYLVERPVPLTESPLVRTALTVLTLAVERDAPLERVSSLLRSPYLEGWKEEARGRARLDCALRRARQRRPSLDAVVRSASEPGKGWRCPRLAAVLAALASEVAAWPETDAPGEWARRFARALERAGWPRGRRLDAGERAAAEAWHDALTALGRRSDGEEPVTPATALETLHEVVRARAFEPPALRDAPVIVVDLADALAATVGLDGVWVMGLDEVRWPPEARPTPFLPAAALREAGCPEASDEGTRERARRITAAVAAAAPEVVFSHAAMVEDGERGPSPLIARRREVRRDELGVWEEPTFAERLAEVGGAVVVDDIPPPPLPAGEVRGGSYLLKLQSGCPFRAFAEFRLRADAPEAVDLGPDQMLRGGLVHDLLEHVWEEIGDQATLAQLDDKALEALVRRHAEDVAKAAGHDFPQVYTPTFRRLEVERLVRLALRWLAVERGRTPFAVAYREKEYEAELEGLTFRLRVDRVDRLPDGRHVVIDYKTGQVDPGDWVGDRPADPQLPLYASVLGRELELAGVAYAQLRSGEKFCFKAALADEGLLHPKEEKGRKGRKGKKPLPPWAELIVVWPSALQALAREFRAGHAPVRPRDEKACEWCALPALCRIEAPPPGRDAVMSEEDDDGAG